MSRARHEMRKDGGKVEPKVKEEDYSATDDGDPNVVKEAEERKHGGRMEKKKKQHGGEVDGKMMKHRLDRPGRKRGGGVGADKSPLTEASKVTDATEHTSSEGNADEGP